MSDSNGSSQRGKGDKPAKPYPDFPLYAHASGRWAKKIRGRTHYFGPWRNWEAALERYKFEVDYLIRGKRPPDPDSCLTVGDLVNHFLAHRREKVDSEEMTERSWQDYKLTGKKIVESLGRHTDVEGLDSDDFRELRLFLGKGRGLVSLGNEIGRARVIFNYASKNALISTPVRMGVGFEKPSAKAIRKERESKPAKIFELHELRRLYQNASAQMQCFMLLGLNAGLGNSDIGQMEQRHIKEGGWVEYPRPKTLVDRSFPLWPETAELIDQIKVPTDGLLFKTKYGNAWHRDGPDRPLSSEFRKLCVACGCHQSGRGFYSLRHQFRTLADGSRDKVAIDRIMGHADRDMGDHYREWIEPERLKAVVDHVREWLKPMWWKV